MSTSSDILKRRSLLVENGVKKLREAHIEIANKIGFALSFEKLSNEDLKAYFILFDERLLDMFEHLEDLILLHGYCSWVVIEYAHQMGLRINELDSMWCGTHTVCSK